MKFSYVVIGVITLLVTIWVLTRFSPKKVALSEVLEVSLHGDHLIDQVRVKNLDGRVVRMNKYANGRESVQN